MTCACCASQCEVVSEVVYYGNLTGVHLEHDGDSFPGCNPSFDLPEQITGTFTLGTATGCQGVRCGNVLSFRFWRNLHTTCNGGVDGDITTQTVDVECVSGSVIVTEGANSYTLNAGDTHTFSDIEFDPNGLAVPNSSYGHCFSVASNGVSPQFSVTATLDWNNETDHDLYGRIDCGACA